MNDKDKIAWLETEVAKLTRRLIEYFEKPTLRDQFAMSALTGMFPMDPECINLSRDDYAVEAYRVADAMLESRKAK